MLDGRGGGRCAIDDTTAAIDAAVADGVDVINYSIGSDSLHVIGPDEVAFLGASDAGVFVANSAGNAGPGAETVGSPASVPWLTSVAAATNSRAFRATATITDAPGADLALTAARRSPRCRPRRSSTPRTPRWRPPRPRTPSSARRARSTRPRWSGRSCCASAASATGSRRARSSRKPAAWACSSTTRSNPQDLSAYPYWIPTVALTHADGLLREGGDRRRRQRGEGLDQRGPAAATAPAVLAAFSSRGPQTAVPDLAKPDLTAPGVDILAAAADQTTDASGIKPGRLFQVISGTSMSSPHVAGAGALLTQLHPTFSTAELKSSLMTSADPAVQREDGATQADRSTQAPARSTRTPPATPASCSTRAPTTTSSTSRRSASWRATVSRSSRPT